MAKTKAEMKSAWDEYHALLRAARDAQRSGDWPASVEFACRSLPHVDGMMQYGRKYEQLQFESVETIDIILKRAPLLMDAAALEQLETLLVEKTRIDKHASDDLAAELTRAVALLWDAHRLWNHLESLPHVRQDELRRNLGGDQDAWRAIAEAWEHTGLLKRTPESGSYRLDFITKLDEPIAAKCGSCGVIVRGVKSKLFEARTCPKCKIVAAFTWLVQQPADLSREQ